MPRKTTKVKPKVIKAEPIARQDNPIVNVSGVRYDATGLGGITPQGQIVSETPKALLPSGGRNLSSYSAYLTDSGARYGKLGIASWISTPTKLEMLRDYVINFCQAFVTAALLKANRIVECADENKRKFFEAMLRGTNGWEWEYILQASMAIPLGGIGLIKRFEFGVPQSAGVGAPPVWNNQAKPYICSGFYQIDPSGASPKFDGNMRFDGIDHSGGHVDRFYSLWVTIGRHRAFGRYSGFGRLECSYWPWWMGQFTGDQFVVYLQKNVDRIPVVGFPPKQEGATDENQVTALRIADMARSGASVAIPTTMYTQTDTTTGAETMTDKRRWTMEFLDGSNKGGEFLMMLDGFDARKALGYLVPPQGFLKVGGGDLGGPTTADVLLDTSEQELLVEAGELDMALNRYVFPTVDSAIFPAGGPPVRVRTVGLAKNSLALLEKVVTVLLGRQDVPATTVDLEKSLEMLGIPVTEDEPEGRDEGEQAPAEGEPRSQIEIAAGGPESGNWGHKGRPGQLGGSAPGGGLGSMESGEFEPHATVGTWKAEDKIEFVGAVNLDDSVDGSKVTHEEVVNFLRSKLPESEMVNYIKSGEDIDEIEITEIDGGMGWVRIRAIVTPSVEAGQHWLEDTEYSEEYRTYHEMSSVSGAAEGKHKRAKGKRSAKGKPKARAGDTPPADVIRDLAHGGILPEETEVAVSQDDIDVVLRRLKETEPELFG